MAKFKLVALSTPLAGKEEAFNEWYQNTHLQELIALPGVKRAQRFKQVHKMMGADSNPYLAVYDIECDDPMAFLGALGEAAAAGRVTAGDTMDMSTTYTSLFTEFGEAVVAGG
jgi:3-hydroxymyristoyl/3-hydroxydecanoyl-(acyl carrier protein) dehydratase